MAQCNGISRRCQSKNGVGSALRRRPYRYGGNCYFAIVGGVPHVVPTSSGLAPPVMQVLIRKTGTTLYWNADGRWTASREQASDLREVCRAVLLCIRRGWTDAELVIRFEQTSGEMTVRVASLPDRRTVGHTRQSRRDALCRRLSRLASMLPFRRRRISFGCRRNVGPGGLGRR